MPRRNKRERLEKDVERFWLEEPYQYYKKKLWERHKNPNINHLAWIVFADYLLLKKSNNWLCKCVTCWKELFYTDKNMHPWHYRPQGNSKFLKYEEDNVRPQCKRCNVMLNGNYREYAFFIIKTFWKEKEQYLRTTQKTKNWKNYELAELILERWKQITIMKATIENNSLFN